MRRDFLSFQGGTYHIGQSGKEEIQSKRNFRNMLFFLGAFKVRETWERGCG